MTAPDTPQSPSVPEGAVWTTVAEAKRCGWDVQFYENGPWTDAHAYPRDDDRYVLARPKPLPPLPREWAEEVIAALDPNGDGRPLGWGDSKVGSSRRRLFDAATAALASQDGES